MSDDQIRQPRRRRAVRAGRRGTAALAAVLLVGGTGAAAYAYWQATSTSPDGIAVADTVQAGARPTVSAAKQDLTVSWAASTTAGGRAVSGYTVQRYSTASGGTAVPATGACSGVVTNLSCIESAVPNGTWYYTVTPVLGNWAGTEGSRGAGAIADGIAPSVSVAGITPTPNSAGYNNSSPVSVSLAAQDQAGGSGVASISYTVDGGQSVTVPGGTANVSVAGDGTHTVAYSATDVAGNVSAAQQVTVRIDTKAPGAPALVVPTFVNLSNVSAVPVSGSAEALSTVKVVVADAAGHTTSPTVTASSNGSWSLPTLNLSGFVDGPITVTATATDAAGNTSPATTATLTKDTVAPGAPSLVVPTSVSSKDVASETVSGTAEPGASVALTVSDAGAVHSIPLSVTAKSDGSWSLTGLNFTGLTDGQLTYTATATDAAGNTGPSVTQTDTKKTSTVLPTFTAAPAKITSDAVGTVQVSGTAEPGASVAVSASNAGGSSVPSTVTANTSTGVWATTLNLSSLASGSFTYTAQATDTYGNVSGVATATGRIGPKVSYVKLSNPTGATGKVAPGDVVTIVFNEPISPTSLCSTWTGASSTWTGSSGLNVQITHNGSNDTLTLSSTGCTTANFGTVFLGANYTTAGADGSLQFKGSGVNQSTVSLSSDQTTLTIRLGSLFKGTPPTTSTTAGAPSYQGSATDVGGVSLGSGPSVPGAVSGF
ncbi:beta strand repeat-containing protein [Sinomonas susongensis]|uniref:beta strand repeat-containing protein n=1 Tax=Sinomonas susongensis TaxID=1324851 RepID=UPI0014864483|nr:Ig-like domain-containing protein [Sinomonas susongensis]